MGRWGIIISSSFFYGDSMENPKDIWNRRITEAELSQRFRDEHEKKYEVRIHGTIMVDVDETVELFALDEKDAREIAMDAIDVTDLVQEVAEDLDCDATIMEEEE
jgi:hypothetical protein